MMVLVVDITRCIGCYNCRTACKDEHVGNGWYMGRSTHSLAIGRCCKEPLK